MKRLAILAAALLCPLQILAQELDIRLIPRVDFNLNFPQETSGTSPDFGNTSLYTLIDGSIAGTFSYSVSAHLFSFCESIGEAAELYTGTLYSDSNNWLDWANVTWSRELGSGPVFSLSAGKDMMAIGCFETDEYDFDSHFGLNTLFWNNTPIYQWGASAALSSEDESTTVKLQLSTSPYGGMLFKDRQGLAASLYFRGEYGPYSNISSINTMGSPDGFRENMLAIGNRLTFGGFTFTLDYFLRCRAVEKESMRNTLKSSLDYDFGPVGVFFSAGFEQWLTEDETDDNIPFITHRFIGGGLNWYPLKDSRDLRIHGIFSADNSGSMAAGVGVTYNFSIFSK